MGTAETRLIDIIRKRREQLGLNKNVVATAAGIAPSTYQRIEQGTIAAPRAEVILAIAEVLDLPTSDLLAAAGWIPKHDLPTLRPYLRTKYHLTDKAVADIEATFQGIADRYGIDFDRDTGGPANGEDE